ncbi:MAG: class I SAM-dependent methyltransferase [Synergistaceae bacterium]|jgi:SAM-dependent methyltransferase|nr:class I SAM-dependent methyltransferase [Synergistaceae bacterium]
MGIVSYLNQLFLSQAYDPHPFWGIFLNKSYIDRRELMSFMRRTGQSIVAGSDVLDFGCGGKPYRGCFDKNLNYVGLEYDTPGNREHSKADVFYDGDEFPFPDDSFDAVLCTQVLEHTNKPDFYVKEMRRVMRDGGKAIITVPFMFQQHAKPYDFFRYSEFGLRHILEKNGFIIEKLEKNPKGLSVIFVLLSNQMPRFKSDWMNGLVWVTLGAFLNIMGLLFKSRKDSDLFLNLLVSARVTKP